MSAGHRRLKILLPVPTMLLIWGILSTLRRTGVLVLSSDVSGCFLLRTLLLLRLVQGVVLGNWLRKLRFLCTVVVG